MAGAVGQRRGSSHASLICLCNDDRSAPHHRPDTAICVPRRRRATRLHASPTSVNGMLIERMRKRLAADTLTRSLNHGWRARLGAVAKRLRGEDTVAPRDRPRRWRLRSRVPCSPRVSAMVLAGAAAVSNTHGRSPTQGLSPLSRVPQRNGKRESTEKCKDGRERRILEQNSSDCGK